MFQGQAVTYTAVPEPAVPSRLEGRNGAVCPHSRSALHLRRGGVTATSAVQWVVPSEDRHHPHWPVAFGGKEEGSHVGCSVGRDVNVIGLTKQSRVGRLPQTPRENRPRCSLAHLEGYGREVGSSAPLTLPQLARFFPEGCPSASRILGIPELKTRTRDEPEWNSLMTRSRFSDPTRHFRGDREAALLLLRAPLLVAILIDGVRMHKASRPIVQLSSCISNVLRHQHHPAR